MLGPLYAVFAGRIGGDILDITGAWAAYLVVAGILSIVIGRYARDKLKLQHWMMIGYGLNTVGTFGYLFVFTPLSLFIVQIVLGIASALASPTWDALYSNYGSKKRAGINWGLAEGSPQIVVGIAILLGGLIVTYAGFSILFLIMGSIQIVATAVQARLLWFKK